MGSLVIVGGAEDRTRTSAILRKILSLATVGDPEVLVIDAASGAPARFVRHYREAFQLLGARAVHTPRLDRPRDASDPEFLALVERAHVTYFAGGDQERLVHVLRGTPAHGRMLHRHAAGEMIVGGTSAGAAALSRTMISRGDSFLWPRKGCVRLAEGLGFTDLIIDQHFSQRDRLGRLIEALAKLGGDACGAGIDEDTALVLSPDGGGEVVGQGGVAMLSLIGDGGASWPRTGYRDIVSISVTLRVLRGGDRIRTLGRAELAVAQGHP